MKNQLNRGQKERVMYIENKHGLIDGASARVGWVRFSKTGRTIYYRDKCFQRHNGTSGNFMDLETGEEYWISGIKKRGSNSHPCESIDSPVIDEDALDAYRELKENFIY